MTDEPTATAESDLSLVTVTVNLGDVHQTIDGFGVAQPGGDRSKPWDGAILMTDYPARDSVMDLAFSPVKGIGLSILRMRIDAMMSPGLGTWNDADPDQAWVMREAAARGPVKIFATAWSPPGWMKDSNSTIAGRCTTSHNACTSKADCGNLEICVPGKLLPSMYQSFAAMLAHFAGPWATANGVNIYAVSMANEPDGGIQTWETCQWSGSDIATFLSANLAPAFAAAHLTTKVMAPETARWDPTEPLMSATYANPTARARVDIDASHLYGGDSAQPMQGARASGKRVWMTETGGRHHIWDMDGALGWAKEIHDGLTSGQISAWCWFILFGDKAFSESGMLIGVTPAPALAAVASPLFFALGNFSRFIRPGFVRIGASASGLLDVSAYRDPASDQFVVVAINRNAQAVNVKLAVQGTTTAQTVVQHTTSATQSLQRQHQVPLSSTLTVPAQSVVTFVSSAQGVNRTADILWHDDTTNAYKESIVANGRITSTVELARDADLRFQGIGDFNGDGTSDVLWRRASTGEFSEWVMSEGRIEGPPLLLFSEPAEWQVQGIGDFNHDGISDVLWRNVNTGQFVVWLMSFGRVSGSITLYAEPAEWQVQGIGDFNGDGTSDILWRNVITGQFTEWLMANGQVGSTVSLYAEPAEWQVATIGDFNGDQTSDILWHNVNTGEFSEWLMTNGGVGTSLSLYTEPAAWQVQGAGDFNADGTSDVLWRNTTTGEVAIWPMVNGYVGTPVVLPTQPLQLHVQGLGDFNGR